MRSEIEYAEVAFIAHICTYRGLSMNLSSLLLNESTAEQPSSQADHHSLTEKVIFSTQ